MSEKYLNILLSLMNVVAIGCLLWLIAPTAIEMIANERQALINHERIIKQLDVNLSTIRELQREVRRLKRMRVEME